jgi:hypothetical protein
MPRLINGEISLTASIITGVSDKAIAKLKAALEAQDATFKANLEAAFKSPPPLGTPEVPAAAAPPVHLVHNRMILRRQSRARTNNLTWTVACCGMFGALLALGSFTGLMPVLGSSVVASRKPPVDRPTDRFAGTQAGSILIPVPNTGFCEQVLFNNKNGSIGRSEPVLCDEPPVDSNPESKNLPSLLGALRDGFGKH